MNRILKCFACGLLPFFLAGLAMAQDPINIAPQTEGRQKARKLRRLDANNDGKLSRAEWKGKPRVFQKLDTNNDGFVTAEEIRQRRHKGPNDTPPAPVNPKPTA